MFSGIVEAQVRAVSERRRNSVVELVLDRPINWNDLQLGDSIAVDGICLTLEAVTSSAMHFALGLETLAVTGWREGSLNQRIFNLERSLALGDRVHGHIVTGHVDAMGSVVEAESSGDYLDLTVEFPEMLKPYIWVKGCICVNGVSLTVNRISNATFSVGLIPETLRRTNLGALKANDRVTLEIDNMARGLVHLMKLDAQNNGRPVELDC